MVDIGEKVFLKGEVSTGAEVVKEVVIQEAAKTGASGAFYSVAYEMKLANNLYPGKGYSTHFTAANKSLSNAMTSDAAFAIQCLNWV